MPTPNLAPLIAVPLMGWAMYRRIRRQFGRQPLKVKPIIVRLVILGSVTLALTAVAVLMPTMTWAIAGGLSLGAAIGVTNLKLTRFEWTPEGDYYYPHPYIGAALSLLLIARVAYRYAALGGMQAIGNHPQPPPGQSPLTFAILALLIGYYVAFAIGVLIVRRGHHRAAS
jgi:hypothetical protein